MKRLLLILLFATSFCQAQNYQCLQSGVKHYFTNSNGYLRGIRIDSVITSGSTAVYYPYHTPRGRYLINPILDSNGGSWLGKKVIQYANGTYVFDNIWNDSVIINTQANVGDSWVFYRDTSCLLYKAQLMAKDTMTVLGAIDSVKRILVTAWNCTGIVTTDPVDSFQIILSKNNGFVQIFDLYTFPYHAPDSSYTQGFDYYLDNLAYSQSIYPYFPTQANSIFSLIHFIDPSYEQLYQWNVGDVYEYSVCNSAQHFGSGCYPVDHYYIDTITAVNITSGSVSYNFSGTVSSNATPLPLNPTSYWGPYIYSTTSNSGILTYDSTLLIDTTSMPEEFNHSALYTHSRTPLYTYFPNDSSNCIESPLYTMLGIPNIGYIVGIEYYGFFEVYASPTTYKSPLGLLNSSNSGAAGAYTFDVQAKNLIYYNRSGSVCGSLLIPPTLVNNITILNSSIVLYPNPTTNELTMSESDNINTITITNLIGQTVYTHEYNSPQVQVDVANLPIGIYFVKINNTEVRKFVKE